jgi:hypothetical protein
METAPNLLQHTQLHQAETHGTGTYGVLSVQQSVLAAAQIDPMYLTAHALKHLASI